jgi:hypothetical protein
LARDDTNSGGEMSSRDLVVAGLVASGLSYPDVAGRLKVSVRTVKRAMALPAVRSEVDAIRERTVEAGLGVLLDGFRAAVAELGRLVQHGTAADSVKLGAVRLSIDAVLRVREQVTLARQMEELQRQFQALQEAKPLEGEQ